MKTCKDCLQRKPLEDFTSGKAVCKACRNAKPQTRTSAQNWKHGIKRRYGITPADYDALLEKQGGVCAICESPSCATGRRLAVDHDHNTGHVRGLLCAACNLLLGKARDDIALLTRSIAYLKDPTNGSRTNH